VIFLYISTPFYLAWPWIFLLVVLFYLQNLLFKNCLLTNAQLKDRKDVAECERSFYAYYFKKMGLKINPVWVKKYFAYSLLWTVLAIALLWQLILDKTFLFN
jgi:hypothetical protein